MNPPLQTRAGWTPANQGSQPAGRERCKLHFCEQFSVLPSLNSTYVQEQELAMSAKAAPEQALCLRSLLKADLRGLEDRTSLLPVGPSPSPHSHSGHYHQH